MGQRDPQLKSEHLDELKCNVNNIFFFNEEKNCVNDSKREDENLEFVMSAVGGEADKYRMLFVTVVSYQFNMV